MAESEITPALLSAMQACQYLQIGKSNLYELIRAGKFGPAPLKLGRCVRFRKTDLDAWMEAKCPSRERWQAMQKGGLK